MAQPIPKKVKENNPELCKKTFNTLLVDGSNILEVSSLADNTMSSGGKQIGGIFQFLLQLKILMQKGNFRYVYVFWDGENSGIERFKLLPSYKANRDKSYEDNDGLSDYMKEVNARIKSMQNRFFKKEDPVKLAVKKRQKEIFYWQRDIVIECLENLFVRQCLCDGIEADDFIGYYVTHKKDNEKIVICTNDRDTHQLIAEDVIIYEQRTKQFINAKNHKEINGYCYKNVLLKKILCGDTSDNIKGIKGLGEKTLLTNMSEIKDREVTLEEVIERARQINEERLKSKKKPLKWAENIVNRVTDGCQGNKIYEINRKVIDLKNPLMNKEAIDMIDGLMYAPIDPEGRSLEELYRVLCENDVDTFKDASRFSNFFNDFLYLIDKEKRNLVV